MFAKGKQTIDFDWKNLLPIKLSRPFIFLYKFSQVVIARGFPLVSGQTLYTKLLPYPENIFPTEKSLQHHFLFFI